MTVTEILAKSVEYFRSKGIESAKLDAELLVGEVLNLSRVELYLHFERLLVKEEVDKSRELVQRRGLGEPVAYILGYKDFYKYRFIVSPSVLVPRPETEHIVEESLEWFKKNNNGPLRVVDLGTGSGCIGLSLASEVDSSEVLCVDVSAGAIAVAEKNAKALGVFDKIKFIEKDAAKIEAQDLPAGWQGQCDLVTANPPYIALESADLAKNVKDHEPHLALFSEKEGLEHIEQWAKQAIKILRPGGLFISEIGSDQGERVAAIFKKLPGLASVVVKRDYSGLDRWVEAQRE